ncbi:MAG: sulfatase-like hydrolase/transferase [Planctomycetota bacterium]
MTRNLSRVDRLLPPAFLLWCLGLKLSVVLQRGGIGLGEGLGYLCPDLALAALILVPGILFLRAPLRPLRVLSILVLVLLAELVALQHGMLGGFGTLLDWPLLGSGLANFGDVDTARRSSARLSDQLLLLVPVLVLVAALWEELRGRRRPVRATLARARGYGGVALVAFGLGLAVLPARAPHPELGGALLGPFLSFGSTGPTALPTEGDLLPMPEALGEPWTRRPADAPRPNFVLLFLESVAARATTPYAPGLSTTPYLAALARRGLMFERAYCMVPHTTKSLLTALSGHAPLFTLDRREVGRLPAGGIAGRLRGLGYRTAFFQTAVEEFEDRRLLVQDLGFEEFYGAEDLGPREDFVYHFGQADELLVEPMLAWVREDRTRPFLLAAINIDSHHDYALAPGVVQEEWEVPADHPDRTEFLRYLQTVHYLDGVIERFLTTLEREGLLEDTVVILAGDHGEGFLEHGKRGHDENLYEEGVRVPLIVLGPEALVGPPRRVGGLRQLQDLTATVADLVGVPDQRRAAHPTLGRSLLAAPDEDRVLYMFSYYENRSAARLTGDAKTLWQARPERLEWFRLDQDPHERGDLTRTLPEGWLAPKKRELDVVKRSVEAWYQASRALEVEDMVLGPAPAPGEGGTALGPALVLEGTTGPATADPRTWLDVEVVLRVTGTPSPTATLQLSASQDSRDLPLRVIDGPERCALARHGPGTRLRVPLRFRAEGAQPGRLRIGLAYAEPGVEATPVRIHELELVPARRWYRRD